MHTAVHCTVQWVNSLYRLQAERDTQICAMESRITSLKIHLKQAQAETATALKENAEMRSYRKKYRVVRKMYKDELAAKKDLEESVKQLQANVIGWREECRRAMHECARLHGRVEEVIRERDEYRYKK